MKFTFKATKLQSRKAYDDVIDIEIVVEDPATQANAEFLGHLTMFKTQWEMLKSVIMDGTSRYLMQEVEVEFGEEK